MSYKFICSRGHAARSQFAADNCYWCRRKRRVFARRYWRMPEWMKPFAVVVITGSSEPDRVTLVERMINESTDPQINLPVSIIEACVKSQVSMLFVLKEKGCLVPPHALEAKKKRSKR